MTKPPLPSSLHLMDRDPDWTLLGRFLDGDCSPEEAEAVARWAAEDPANGQCLDFMRQVWTESATPRADVEAGWQTVRHEMDEARRAAAAVRPLRVTPGAAERSRGARLRSALVGAAAAAAAAVLAVGGSYAWRQREAASRIAAAQAVREYATTRGQRAQVTLVDGTRVSLNVDSRLRVPAGYGAAARDVELEGEAYFVVRHDAERPFRVYTRGAVSEDLGTEFSVRAYAEDPDVVVVVAEGLVAMRADDDPADTTGGIELAPGQMGRLDSAGQVTVTDGVDLAGQFGWREDRLEFEDRPLADVLLELERWYDLDIALEDSALARVPLTISLGQHTADQALGIVAGIVDLRFTREGRQARLSPKPVPR